MKQYADDNKIIAYGQLSSIFLEKLIECIYAFKI